MRIKAITLQGYKSFASRYTFVFPPGITAIVGPNGSGKSNVADAIRWVLGEQRQSAMRARRAEDMIFAGTEGRSRAGLAQVTVAFDNADGWLDLEFGEVEVSRRAHRDGSLQALINGAAVRLRDVQDLLSGRLGQGNYTVIGQGQVDAALSLRPEERRGLIDEAAGLVPLQRRRERCLRQLAETHDNLTRVRDITEDLGPRLQRMSRLARRAEQHQMVIAELQGLLQAWYGYHWHRVQRELSAATAGTDALRQAVDQRRRALEAALAGRDAAKTRAAEAEAALVAARDALERRLREDALTRERAALAAARLEGLRQRRDELAADLAQARTLAEALAERQAAEQETLAAKDLATAEWTARAAEARQALTAAQERRSRDEQQRLARERALLEAAAQLAAQESRVRLARQELEALEPRQATLAAQVLTLRQQAETAEGQRREAQTAADARAQAQLAGEAALAAATEAFASARAQAAEAQSAQREAEEARRGLERRASALDALIGQLDAGSPGLDILRKAGAGGLLGSVGELLEIDARWETAVAAVLGNRLQAIVLDGPEALAAAAELLGEGLAGQATLIDARAPAPESARLPADGPACPSAPGLIDQLFWQVRLCDSAAAAKAAAVAQPRLLCAGIDGTVFQGEGLLSLGPPARDLLSLRRERRSLPEQLAALEVEQAALRTRGQEAQAAGEAAKAAVTAAEAELRGAQAGRREAETALARCREAAERTARELAWTQESVERLGAEGQACAARLLEHERTLVDARSREAEAQAALAAGAPSPDAGGDLETLRQALAQAEAERAEAAQRQAAARAAVEGLASELKALRERQATLAARDLALAEGIAAAEAESEQLAAGLAQAARAEDAEAGLAARQAALDEARRLAEEAEAGLEARRQAVEAGERELTELRLAATRTEDRLERLYDQLRGEADTLGLDLGGGQLSLGARDQVSLPEVAELAPDLEERVEQLRGRLRSLGAIDREALSSYEESQAHFDHLQAQEADLRAADADLRQLLARLDQDIAAGFQGTFSQVAEAFSRYFPLLFGGGEAELLLTTGTAVPGRESDGEGAAGRAEPGLEIMARPPGKRRQPLSLLSGGERALTAVALTFALLEVSGTPFVVLDEVDAALDEANVDRFCQALRTLAEGRQVVVITHNRGTIQTAATVYGVSMAEDGASQVISLRVDELPAA